MEPLTIACGTQRLVLQPGQEAIIGRALESQIVVDDPRVSRQHLRVTSGPHGWMIQNVGRAGTWVLGQPVSSLVLSHSLEARLGVPDGPAVVFGVTAPSVAPPPPGAPVLPPGLAMPTPVGAPHPTVGEEVASAVNILVPIRSWIHNPSWRQGFRLLVIPYALLPLIFLVVFQNAGDLRTPGWAYSLYVAPLWAIAFWYLIKPGHLGWRHVIMAVFIVGWTVAWIKLVTIWVNDNWFSSDSFWSSIGTGYNEEITKALPVLLVAFLVLLRFKRKYDVRMWMYMGTIAGLAFGVYEAATIYAPLAIVAVNRANANSLAIEAILLFAFRVFVDGFQHAIWAGMSGFFIGLAVNYRRRRIPLLVFGISIAAILHGVNDWLAGLGTGVSQWGWILLNAFSLFLFLGYSMSAHQIEEDVSHAPLFRGESILAEVTPAAGRPMSSAPAGAPAPPMASAPPGGVGAAPGPPTINPVPPSGAPPPPRY